MMLLLIFSCLLSGAALLLLLLRYNRQAVAPAELQMLHRQLDRLEQRLQEDFRISREEGAAQAQAGRRELAGTLKEFSAGQRLDTEALREGTAGALRLFGESFEKNVASFNQLQREKFSQLEARQTELVQQTERQLERMRLTVDEKLQQTLNERLGQSFEIVTRQLQQVQKGLGEMHSLAQDVGGLKKILGNVKLRGGLGEVQLEMLLENILAPDQYEANVKTREGGAGLVEFAIKFPNRDGERKYVWLPIDAKFPREVYESLQQAHEAGDLPGIDNAQKALEATIRRMARDISGKYLDPPNTTDFAILFLPFEGIYAEVVRKAGLLEEIQRDCKILITGPSTLAALLHSLQMGFRTLAIQRRSSEVWQILGSVKKEFESFGGLLDKAQKNLQTASNQIDEVMGKRTRAIQRKLKGVEMPLDAGGHPLVEQFSESPEEE